MPKDIREPKLNDDLRMKVCERYARFESVLKIQAYLKKEHGITVSKNAVEWYRECPTYVAIIDKLRDKYLSAVMEIPISHKRVRLERLDALYHKALSLGKAGEAKDMLIAARDEIEGRASTNQIGIIMNRIEMISDAELEERLHKIKREMSGVIDVKKEEEVGVLSGV